MARRGLNPATGNSIDAKPVTPSKQPRRASASGVVRKEQNDRRVIDYAALAQFRYHLRVFLAFSDANTRNAGLTSQQYQVLLTIKGFSGQQAMSVGELAQFMLIKNHSAVELVERMAKLKLLEKTVDTDDNRRVMLTLTKLGRTRLSKVANKNFQRLQYSSLTFAKVLKSFRRSQA